MAVVISLEGINQAVANLNYQNEKTLKYRLVQAISRLYKDEGSIESIQGVGTEELVKRLWDTGDDPTIIKGKRKNLSSIKSSVNADLRKLYRAGKNPDGITIGRNNIFVMADEAKDKLLEGLSVAEASSLEKIAESLKVIKRVLSKPEALTDDVSYDGSIQLEELRGTIQELADKLGPGGDEGGLLVRPLGGGQRPETAEDDAKLVEGAEISAEGVEDEGKREEIVKVAPEVVDETEIVDEVAPEEEEDLEELSEDEVAEESEEAEDEDEAEIVDSVVEVELGEEEAKPEEVEDVNKDEAEPEEAEELEALDEAEIVEDLQEAEVDDGHGEDRSMGFRQIGEAANIINEILSSAETVGDAGSSDRLDKLEQLRDIIGGLSQKVGVTGEDGGGDGEKQEGPKVIGSGMEGAAGDSGSGRGEVFRPEGVISGEGVEDEGEREEIVKVAPEIVDEDEIVDEAAPEEEEEIEEIEEEPEDEIVDEAEVIAEIFPEEEEDLEEVSEDEVEEELEEAEDEDEVIENQEFTGDEEDLEGAEFPEGPEEAEAVKSSGQEGSALGHLEDGYLDDIGQEEDNIPQDRLLAEEFHDYLGNTDRFYNQYLVIPAGMYILGSKEPDKNEQVERKVHLPRFYMGRFPVTNALFEIFVHKTGYRTAAEELGYSTVYCGRFRDMVDEKTGLVRSTCHAAIGCKTIHGACWYQPEGPGSTIQNKRNHPVVHVSVEDAMAFAAWTGKRLPTECEWEAATRDANGYAFPWGNDRKTGSCNIEESAIADTTPVDKYTEFASNLGIIDALGNVLEWTLDTCEPPSHVKNGSAYHVVKGGSWISGNDIRLSSRIRWNADSPSNIVGFRCVAI